MIEQAKAKDKTDFIVAVLLKRDFLFDFETAM